MRFKDRKSAGQKLAQALIKYKNKDSIVYALPRGGVIVGAEVAKILHLPLDLVITRKIGHPNQPEYAIAAVAENGHMVKNVSELASVDEKWFKEEVEKQRLEAVRRRQKYLPGRLPLSAEGKITILVDDGIATGLTLKAAIAELKHFHPKKIIVAVPVSPQQTAEEIKKEVNEFVALDTPKDFLGSIGAYYDYFPQVSDEEVIELVKEAGTKV